MLARASLVGALALFAGLAAPRHADAQSSDVAAPTRAPFSVDVGAFHESLDNGYSDWDGVDARVMYTGSPASPFASASTQRRREGSQTSYGLGSYLTINRHFYTIADFSVATGGTAVFYPRLRWNVSLVSDTRVVPGLVLVTGYSNFSFGGGSSGSIVSVGPIWYHGPLILSGAVHVNHDDAGGATTASGEVGGQYGAEGRQWLGASLSGGREAYEILAVNPLDVRFTNVGGALFYERWLTTRTAVTARVEYQDKRTAYQRRGLTLSYHVAF